MKKLTRKIVALTLSLVMCISFSNTTFAYADNENISSSAEASKVNWWKIGWIILPIMSSPKVLILRAFSLNITSQNRAKGVRQSSYPVLNSHKRV